MNAGNKDTTADQNNKENADKLQLLLEGTINNYN